MNTDLEFSAVLVERAKTFKDMDTFVVTIGGCFDVNGNYIDSFRFTYSKGTGHRINSTPCFCANPAGDWEKHNKAGKRQWFSSYKTLFEEEIFLNPRYSIAVPPTFKEAMQALAQDADSYRSARGIDSFAEESGITKPSAAIKAYAACRDASEFFYRRGLNIEDYLEDQ